MVTEKEKETNEEIEALRRENERLSHEVDSGQVALKKLKETLAARESEVAALQQSLSGSEEKACGLGKALGEAIGKYREMLVQANPGILAEMISGESIEAIDGSLKQARTLVERVKQGMETEAAKTRIPAGSPPRTAPDLSGLSPREKIQYGMEVGK